MQDTIVKRGTVIERGIVSEKCIIGENTYIGQGENTPHETKAHIYHNGITAIGAYTNIPENVVIGKNCEISKIHEETVRGTLEEVIAHFTVNEPKGEIVIVLAGLKDKKDKETGTEV